MRPSGRLLEKVKQLKSKRLVKEVAKSNRSDFRAASIASSTLASIVDSSDDAIYSTDLNSIITSWNSGAERIFGYSAAEVIGTSIMRVIPVGQQEEEHDILDRIRLGKKLGTLKQYAKPKTGRR
jgi:two-component system sensor histidine kinase VicK